MRGKFIPVYKKQDLACKYVALRRQINVFYQNILPEWERT
jgi:hypothetical protein